MCIAAGKKKSDAENIPPSEPMPKPAPPTPVSPSKRRQAASHYSDVECSPSKKRDIAAATLGIQNMAIEERGLLFGNNSTNIKTMEMNAEAIDMGPVKAKPTAGGRRVGAARAKDTAESKKVMTKRMEVWVELETAK